MNITGHRQHLRDFFHRLSRRERMLALITTGLLAGIVLYYAGWQWPRRWQQSAASLYQEKLSQLAWMKAGEAALQAMPQKPAMPASAPEQSIASLMNMTAKTHAIVIARLEPEGDTGAHVTIDNVSFNELVDWLRELKSIYGVSVTHIAIHRVADMTGHVIVDFNGKK